ncbi:nuclear transport factor 2 family protein [Hyphomonas sp. FCG-A18]|uniref:nuclear transport factor 2 family protein n=1 Tax=Hyphomonas sp. FCG-A18 TaxID=3080019 RepID=UPI002B280BE9|nr:nuclear transport factor 2 family protein [Hyphomonas sp. FCG-A18]
MLTEYEKIQNHLAKYCFLVDSGSVGEIVDLFWDDATLEFNGLHVGEEAIRACYTDWAERLKAPVEGLRHLLHMPVIEIESSHARSYSYADADAHSRRQGKPIQNRAMFEDKLVKRDGQWRFIERKIIWMRGINETA